MIRNWSHIGGMYGSVFVIVTFSKKFWGNTEMKKIFKLPSRDGIHQLHVVMWIPEGKVRAVLQISHGMVEYVERYEEFAAYANQAGIVVVGNDHLGHGDTVRSEKEYGYFCKSHMSATVVADLHRVTIATKKRYPGVPYFLLGHSMGSFMARRYLMTYGKELTGAIVCGTGKVSAGNLFMGTAIQNILENWKGSKYRSKWFDQLIFGNYNKRVVQPKSKNDWMCSDRLVVDKRDREKKCNFIFTMNGFRTLFETITYIQKTKNIEKIPKSLPMFFIAGSEDPVGQYAKGVRALYAQYKAMGMDEMALKIYDGYRHEILMEVEKLEVFRDVIEWMDQYIW